MWIWNPQIQRVDCIEFTYLLQLKLCVGFTNVPQSTLCLECSTRFVEGMNKGTDLLFVTSFLKFQDNDGDDDDDGVCAFQEEKGIQKNSSILESRSSLLQYASRFLICVCVCT